MEVSEREERRVPFPKYEKRNINRAVISITFMDHKILNMFNNFAGLVADVKFDMPKMEFPAAVNLLPANLLCQVPLMAQGKVTPPDTVRDYSANKRSRSADIEEAVEKVLLRMKKNDDSDFGNSNPQYIVLNIDGREFIRWIQKQNEQNLNCGGPGLFPSAV